MLRHCRAWKPITARGFGRGHPAQVLGSFAKAGSGQLLPLDLFSATRAAGSGGALEAELGDGDDSELEAWIGSYAIDGDNAQHRDVGMAFERWPLDRPENHQDMHLMSFNNWLVFLLTDLRSCSESPSGSNSISTWLVSEVQSKVSSIPGMIGLKIQGSSARATSIEDIGGLAWGPDMASDVDILILFEQTSQDLRACLRNYAQEVAARLQAKQSRGQWSISTGRFGLLVTLDGPTKEAPWLEMDVIPGLRDTIGGHWEGAPQQSSRVGRIC